MPDPVQIIRDTATPELQRIHAALQPGRRRPLMLALGGAARNEYRAWFRAKDRGEPDTRGFPRSHFWNRRIAGATELDASQTTASQAVLVVADRAINAHVYGGTWGPRPGKKNLAIPLRPEAAGKNPSSNLIPDIFFFRSRFGKGGGYLARREGKKLVAYWRLVPRVRVRRDPSALPPRELVLIPLVRKARAFLGRNFLRR
jgi:hypothetical protein